MNLLNGGITFFSRYTLATLTSAAILGAGGVSLVQRSSSSEAANAGLEPTNALNATSADDGSSEGTDDNGVSKPQLGQPCVNPSDCNSGYCVDGVCCATACTATCMACNVAGMAGTCSPVAEFDDDPLATPACSGPDAWCNGAGSCVMDLGQPCSKSFACASGHCVDGVCCDSTCTGTCMSCAVKGSAGACSAVPAGQGDLTASSPCNAPTWSCNGAGVCMGAVGATCSSNAGCYSDNCDNGFCGYALPQWVWSQETAACSVIFYLNDYMRIGFTDIVAQADGRVFGIGKYNHPVMGLTSLADESWSSNSFHRSGPHDFQAQVDSSGQGASLSTIWRYYRNTWGSSQSCWPAPTCYEKTWGNGPAITSAGGDVVYAYARYTSRLYSPPPETSTCDYGILSKFAVPQWSLGTGEMCAGYRSSVAGNEAGNIVTFFGNHLQKFDPSGTIVVDVPTPFMNSPSAVALTPSGTVYAAYYSQSKFYLAHADASGALLWSKLADDLGAAYFWALPVDLAVDANGNAIVSFYAYGGINLGNGVIPPVGPKDVVLAKINPQGNVMWAKRFGGWGFTPNLRAMKRTGADEIALALSFDGPVDLGDGQIMSRTVVVKYDADGNLVWRKDLAPVLPSFTTEVISLAISGHPSGAVFVGGSAYGVTGVLPLSACVLDPHQGYPASNPKPLRLFVAKYAP